MEDNKTSKKQSPVNWLVIAFGVVGLSIGGLSLASKNAEVSNAKNVEAQTESVINLPATNEKVNGLEARIEDLDEDKSAEINRREKELREELLRLINLNKTRIERLENITYENAKDLKVQN